MKRNPMVVVAFVILISVYALYVGKCVMADAPARSATTRDKIDVGQMLRRDLADYGVPLTREGLLAGLAHKEAAARAACLQVLAKSGDVDDIPVIAKLLEDPVRYVRMAALRSMNAIMSRRNKLCAQKIWQQSKYPGERLQAAVLLCELGDPSHFEEVLKVLRDTENPGFVQAASSVPGFVKYNLEGEGGLPVDWVKLLADALALGNLELTKAVTVANSLHQIGTPSAISAIRDASKKQKDSNLKMMMEEMAAEKN